MALDDVYQMQVVAQGPNGFMQNGLAFIRTDAAEPTQANFQALADDIKEINRSRQFNQITYRTWRARQVRGSNVTWPTGTSCNPVGGNIFEGTAGGTAAGGNIGPVLPWQCALVVTLRTATIGRRARGRFYTYGFGEPDQANGVWDTSLTTPTNTSWTTFLTNYAVPVPTSGFRLGIWSFRTASGCEANPNGPGHIRVDSPNPAAAFTPVTSHLVRSTVYTQRRRVAGVGR